MEVCSMRSIVRWEPYNDLISLRNAMNRFFEKGICRSPIYEQAWTTTSIPVDMYRTPDAVIVKAIVPGLKANDLQITAHDNLLIIRGQAKQKREATDRQYLCKECQDHAFERTLALPADLDVDQTEAELMDGILILRIPRAVAKKPKQIQIC